MYVWTSWFYGFCFVVTLYFLEAKVPIFTKLRLHEDGAYGLIFLPRLAADARDPIPCIVNFLKYLFWRHERRYSESLLDHENFIAYRQTRGGALGAEFCK